MTGMRSASALPASVDEPLRPRSVFCVIADEHRDRAVAESVCAGRFAHNGVTLELGLEPDWSAAGLADDKEWAIEWAKFYWGLDLAHAFRETAERRFLTAWERLVRSWIHAVRVGSDASHAAGRRIQNWIYAWDIFASTPGFPGLSPGMAAAVVQSLTAQVHDLRDRLTPERNHRTVELYALFIAALALPELDGDRELLDFAIRGLHENLLTDVLPDGVHRERSTHYHMIALRTFLGVRENARRFGVVLPAGYDERLTRACAFALHCHRPDGDIPALSDADRGSYLDLLALAADLLARPDFSWAATGGVRGQPPADRHASFPLGGYFVQRSGWGTGSTPLRDERFLILDCGPLGDGSHGHADLLSVEIAADGRPLVVDPGRYTYSEGDPNWRHWFKGTAAHNTVTVDRLDQTPYSPGKPRGPVARGVFLGRHRGPGLDILQGEATSPCYEVVHARRVLFVADEYWLIEDRLRGQRSHRYDLRFHLAPEFWGQTAVETGQESTSVRTPGLALIVAPRLQALIEEGWVAPSYGVKVPAPVVSLVAEGRADMTFLTLLVPLAPAVPAPRIRVHRADATTIVEVRGTGADGRMRDWIGWHESIGPLDLGPLRLRAVAGWVRQAEHGAVVTSGVAERLEAGITPGRPRRGGVA